MMFPELTEMRDTVHLMRARARTITDRSPELREGLVRPTCSWPAAPPLRPGDGTGVQGQLPHRANRALARPDRRRRWPPRDRQKKHRGAQVGTVLFLFGCRQREEVLAS